tara:strand:+ start:132 stop:443 length:312 start_codon:yes stop_codon:yes gene_type:complete
MKDTHIHHSPNGEKQWVNPRPLNLDSVRDRVDGMSNVEFITFLMEHHSPMNQAVIIHAICEYCKLIEAEDEAPKGWSEWISYTGWKSACHNIIDCMKIRQVWR